MRKLLLTLALLCSACGGRYIKFEPPKPFVGFVIDKDAPKVLPALPTYNEFKAPAIYREWFHEIAECEGLVGEDKLFDALRFYYVNAKKFGQAYVGYALPMPHPKIFLTLSLANTKGLVQHEMLHILSQVNGKGNGHPFALYGYKCNMTPTGWQKL